MDTWDIPSRRSRHPSFSSSLLDSIYRSIDEEAGGEAPEPFLFPTTTTAREEWKKSEIRRHVREPIHPRFFTSTSSSSDSSSYGGFSSSDVESSRRPKPNCIRPVRPEINHSGEKKKSIRSRIRNLSAPSSPGARLADFLNSLFQKKKAKVEEYSVCSSASSYSRRSCLVKTPRSNGDRTVRFGPVRVTETEPKFNSRTMAKELLREMERVDDGEESDSSSDLFELENLKLGSRREYMDELPVYGTTHLGCARRRDPNTKLCAKK